LYLLALGCTGLAVKVFAKHAAFVHDPRPFFLADASLWVRTVFARAPCIGSAASSLHCHRGQARALAEFACYFGDVTLGSHAFLLASAAEHSF
jgi:hypothetical protein